MPRTGENDLLTRRPSLKAAVRRWERIWRVPGLAAHLTVTTSTRLTRALGKAKPVTGAVTLHASLLKGSRKRLLNVLCHETAHVAAYLRHGRTARPHGPRWAALVTAAGFVPNVAHRSPRLMQQTQRRAGLFSIVHTCPVCQSRRFARRVMPRWRCAECVAAGLRGELVASTVAVR